MKFHKDRTAIRSPLEGVAAYREAFATGVLRPVSVFPAEASECPGVWRRLSVADLKYGDEYSEAPLEVSEARITPRAAVVDELTRHRLTYQTFVPVNGPVMVVVAPSKEDDKEKPDPLQITMVPALPGEGVEIAAGTWHTLPFAFASEVLCLSIMHRAELDSYHDVRDLAVEGWIGILEWKD